MDALKVNHGEAAKAEAEKRKAEADILREQSSLTKAQRETIAAQQAEVAQNANVTATRIVTTCGGPDAGATRWQTIVGDSGVTDFGKRRILTAKKY